ncbi:MAG: inorganic diphosphatase [Chloroflexi bacterium]|nr:inorganic diphosphatase [Chloroflexota bacterium]
MRTIDMHAHLPGKALGLAPRATASVLAMLDKAGIDQQVVMTIDGFWFDEVADLPQQPQHFLAEIEHFFQVYKTLEAKDMEIYGWAGSREAHRILAEARRRAW